MSYATEGRVRETIRSMGLKVPHLRRVKGLQEAIQRQQKKKEEILEARTATKDKVALRLPDKARESLPTIVSRLLHNFYGPTYKPEDAVRNAVKVFHGHTPPKRRARVGDIHSRKDRVRGMCIGWKLWAYSDGTRLRLEGKNWVPCV